MAAGSHRRGHGKAPADVDDLPAGQVRLNAQTTGARRQREPQKAHLRRVGQVGQQGAVAMVGECQELDGCDHLLLFVHPNDHHDLPGHPDHRHVLNGFVDREHDLRLEFLGFQCGAVKHAAVVQAKSVPPLLYLRKIVDLESPAAVGYSQGGLHHAPGAIGN